MGSGRKAYPLEPSGKRGIGEERSGGEFLRGQRSIALGSLAQLAQTDELREIDVLGSVKRLTIGPVRRWLDLRTPVALLTL